MQNVHDVLPADDPHLYRREERIRNKKSGEWIDKSDTPDNLLASSIVFTPSRSLLYILFQISSKASKMEDHLEPLVDFANMQHSAAAILLNQYVIMLTEPGDWFLLFESMGSFSPTLLRRAPAKCFGQCLTHWFWTFELHTQASNIIHTHIIVYMCIYIYYYSVIR